jgi:hypothetical protein
VTTYAITSHKEDTRVIPKEGDGLLINHKHIKGAFVMVKGNCDRCPVHKQCDRKVKGFSCTHDLMPEPLEDLI